MANANLTLLATSNTFQDWMVLTNNLANSVNELRNGNYYKDNQGFTIANGSIVISGSLGTLLSVSGNTTISQQLTVATILGTSDATIQGNNFLLTTSTVLAQVANTLRAKNLISNTVGTFQNVNAAGVVVLTGNNVTNAVAQTLSFFNELAVLNVNGQFFITNTGNLQIGGTIWANDALATVNVAGKTNIAMDTAIGQNLAVVLNATVGGNGNVAGILNVATQIVTPLANITTANITTANIATGNVGGVLNVATQLVATLANIATSNTVTANIGTANVGGILNVATQAVLAVANIATENTQSATIVTAKITNANVAQVLNVATQLVTPLANVTTANITTANIATANATQVITPTANITTANVNAFVATSANVSNILNVATQIVTPLANVTTLNASSLALATANIATLNAAGAVVTGNLTATSIIFDSAGSYTQAQGNLTVNNLTVKGNQAILGTVINSSDTLQLRSNVGTDGDGHLDIWRGTTVNANAQLKFASGSGVWQATANDSQTFNTLLTTANLTDTFTSNSTINAATANAVNAAYAGAIANAKGVVANNGVFVAQRQGLNIISGTNISLNVAANGANTQLTDITVGSTSQVATYVNGGLITNQANLNFINTATVIATGSANGSNQSNVSFSVNSAAVYIWSGSGNKFVGSVNTGNSMTGVSIGWESLGNSSGIVMTNNNAPANAGTWDILAANTSTISYRALNDGFSAANLYFLIQRSGVGITGISYGNAQDLPSHDIYGPTTIHAGGTAFKGISVANTNGTTVGYIVGTDINNDAGQLALNKNGVNRVSLLANGSSYINGIFAVGCTSPVSQFTVQRPSGGQSTADVIVGDGTHLFHFNSNTQAGNWNPIVQANDHLIMFTDGSSGTGNLVISPWTSGAGGLRMDSVGNVTMTSNVTITNNVTTGGNLSITGTFLMNASPSQFQAGGRTVAKLSGTTDTLIDFAVSNVTSGYLYSSASEFRVTSNNVINFYANNTLQQEITNTGDLIPGRANIGQNLGGVSGNWWGSVYANTIFAAGKIGVGVLNPTSTIHANGSIRVSNGIFFNDNTAAAGFVLTSAGSFYGVIGNQSQHVWGIGWSSDSVSFTGTSITWNDTGQVGIGTNSPQTTLDVAGTARANAHQDHYSNTGTITGNTNIDLRLGAFFDFTLATSTANITFQNCASTRNVTTFQLLIRQSANGANTVAFTNTIFWSDNTVPVLSTTANTGDLFQFTSFNGGTAWLGAQVMANMKGMNTATSYS